MSAFYFLPALLGIASVMQAALNRQLAARHGLAATALLNNSVQLIVTGALLVLALRWADLLPEIFRYKPGRFPIWAALPGLLGISLVVGLPFAIARIGALRCFVILIAAQLTVSLIWDAKIEGIPPHAYRVAGAVLASLGAVLASIRS